jgi:hypothetical protein
MLYITLIGAYALPTGAPATGRVTFTLSPAVQAGPGGPIVESSITVPLDTDGAFSVLLLTNTDPTITPSGSYYQVHEEVATARRTYDIIVPDTLGATINLAALAPAEPTLPPAVYVLQSVYAAHVATIASTTVLGHIKIDGTSITIDPDGTIHGSGIGDKHYIHTQSSPASTWNITHNLSKRPAITVVDSAGTVYHTEVEYPTLNTAIVRTSAAFAGLAYCN